MARALAADSDVRPSTVKGTRFEIVPLEPEHMRELMRQDSQAYGDTISDPSFCSSVAAAGPSCTALVDGRAIACLGIYVMHPGVGLGWGLVGRDAGPHLLALTRAVVRFLKTSDFLSVRILVALEFTAAHRWAKLLGFHAETPLRASLPGGGDAMQYAWLSQSVNHRRH